MPLLRRKPFSLAEPPEELKPDEPVYQIRFTKEIFRDYPYPISSSIALVLLLAALLFICL